MSSSIEPFHRSKDLSHGTGAEGAARELISQQLIDYRHDGFLAARGTALAGLLIGCLLYIF